jgi:hypothetical protein
MSRPATWKTTKLTTQTIASNTASPTSGPTLTFTSKIQIRIRLGGASLLSI